MFSVFEQSVTDTTADLSFTINPNGADTTYVIRYGDGDPGNDQTTDPVDIGANAGDQQLTATLLNLDPGSTYHFEVIATNSVDTNSASGEDFATAQQIVGTARLPLELDDSGQSNFGCPSTARIDWGDDTTPEQATPDCLFPGDEESPAQYELTANHTYAQPGHYHIQVTYTDIEQTSDQYAQVSPNDGTPPSNTAAPSISGHGQPGQCAHVLRRLVESRCDELHVRVESRRPRDRGCNRPELHGAVGRSGSHADLHGDREQRRRSLEPGNQRGRRRASGHRTQLDRRLRSRRRFNRFEACPEQGGDLDAEPHQSRVRRLRQP